MASDERLQDKRKFTGNVSVRDCNSVLLTDDSSAWRWPFSVSQGRQFEEMYAHSGVVIPFLRPS